MGKCDLSRVSNVCIWSVHGMKLHNLCVAMFMNLRMPVGPLAIGGLASFLIKLNR